MAKANSATTKPSGFIYFSLILESMVPYVERTDIQYGYRSDHSMIVLKFLFGKKEMKRKTFRKFNNSLLKDYAYVKEINEEIKNKK